MNELFGVLIGPEVEFRLQVPLLFENGISIDLKINNQKRFDCIFLTIFPEPGQIEARLLK